VINLPPVVTNLPPVVTNLPSIVINLPPIVINSLPIIHKVIFNETIGIIFKTSESHIVKIKLKVSLCKKPKPKKVINGSKGDMKGLKEAMKGKQSQIIQNIILSRIAH
jgi:hypothetical protein